MALLAFTTFAGAAPAHACLGCPDKLCHKHIVC
jgi:hypothetical protein